MTKITPPDKILQEHAQMLSLQTVQHRPEPTERYGYTTVTGIIASSHLQKRSEVLTGLDLDHLDGVNNVRPKIVTPMLRHRYHHS